MLHHHWLWRLAFKEMYIYVYIFLDAQNRSDETLILFFRSLSCRFPVLPLTLASSQAAACGERASGLHIDFFFLVLNLRGSLSLSFAHTDTHWLRSWLGAALNISSTTTSSSSLLLLLLPVPLLLTPSPTRSPTQVQPFSLVVQFAWTLLCQALSLPLSISCAHIIFPPPTEKKEERQVRAMQAALPGLAENQDCSTNSGMMGWFLGTLTFICRGWV